MYSAHDDEPLISSRGRQVARAEAMGLSRSGSLSHSDGRIVIFCHHRQVFACSWVSTGRDP